MCYVKLTYNLILCTFMCEQNATVRQNQRVRHPPHLAGETRSGHNNKNTHTHTDKTCTLTHTHLHECHLNKCVYAFRRCRPTLCLAQRGRGTRCHVQILQQGTAKAQVCRDVSTLFSLLLLSLPQWLVCLICEDSLSLIDALFMCLESHFYHDK